MKTLSLFALAILALSPKALAMECSAGKLNEDNHIRVVFNEASTEVQLHETAFEVKESDVQTDGFGKYMIIPKKKINVTGEGMEWKSDVFSIMLFNGNTATVYLSMDGNVVQSNTVLTCK